MSQNTRDMPDGSDAPDWSAQPQASVDDAGAAQRDALGDAASALPEPIVRRRVRRTGRRGRERGGGFCRRCGRFHWRLDGWVCTGCEADLREVGLTPRRLLSAATLVTFRALLRRLGSGAEGGPACGRCGYPARGLGGFDCPECGADLVSVGVVSDRWIDRRGAAVLAMAAWAGVVAVVCWATYGLTSRYLVPQQMQRVETLELVSNDGSYDIVVKGSANGVGWLAGRPLPLKRVGVSLYGTSMFLHSDGTLMPISREFTQPICWMQVEYPSGRYSIGRPSRYRDGDDRILVGGALPFSSFATRQFMRCGHIRGRPSEAAEARELAEVVVRLQNEHAEDLPVKLFRKTVISMLQSRPAPGCRYVPTVYAVMVWLTGCGAIAWCGWKPGRVQGR